MRVVSPQTQARRACPSADLHGCGDEQEFPSSCRRTCLTHILGCIPIALIASTWIGNASNVQRAVDASLARVAWLAAIRREW